MQPQYITHAVEGAILLGVFGLMWKMQAESTNKIGIMFKRFDEYKEKMKVDHVSRDVCKIVHENVNRDLQEIKADVKTLLNRERDA